jgi:TPR repeat protein
VERNIDEAIIWYKQAVEKGKERAINELKKFEAR